jgi:hypothetical protein
MTRAKAAILSRAQPCRPFRPGGQGRAVRAQRRPGGVDSERAGIEECGVRSPWRTGHTPALNSTARMTVTPGRAERGRDGDRWPGTE